MSWGSSIKSRARKAFRLALNDLGRRGVTYIRQTVSNPDIYIFNDRGGLSAVIRSEPGEPPWMETSDVAGNVPRLLWKSIGYAVDAGAQNLMALRMGPNIGRGPYCIYAAALEYGTENMEPRPYMAPAREYLVPEMKAELPGLFKAKLAEVNLSYESSMYETDIAATDVAFEE